MFLLALGLLGLVIMGAQKVAAYVNGVPTEVELAPIGDGFLMRKDAAEAFNRMRALAPLPLKVNSAFRSMEAQMNLYQMYMAGTGNLAARPGFSNHQSGIAVDINVGGFDSNTYKWLAANASRFGFINTGAGFKQPEPWHWEYRP